MSGSVNVDVYIDPTDSASDRCGNATFLAPASRPADDPMPCLVSVLLLVWTREGTAHSRAAYQRMLAASGFGALDPTGTLRTAVLAALLMMLGAQTIMAGMFLGVLNVVLKRNR